MACFLVPAGEAVVTTVVQKVIEHQGKKGGEAKAAEMKLKWSKRLGWLNIMLWGGSLLLALEHIWHGEIIASPPFLTAMKDATETSIMLHEIATVGVAMAVTITVIWGIMVLVAELKSRTAKVKVQPVRGGA
ncbi:MAG: hypothetical protein PHG35_06630 [Dehalococcoidales bacterium]|nr:hypothetical protein [Dehalococcoidales bacterium]